MGNIFDILGPVMVGPSSSHTAGAARIGLIARQLFGRQPKRAKVYLHGCLLYTSKALNICKWCGIFCIFDFWFRVHDIEETAEARQSLLHHFRQFYENLNRADENADVESVHGEITYVCLLYTSIPRPPST